jgi:hypothetical protein
MVGPCKKEAVYGHRQHRIIMSDFPVEEGWLHSSSELVVMGRKTRARSRRGLDSCRYCGFANLEKDRH